jgi:nucleoside-diphosphate-sugar epimerase
MGMDMVVKVLVTGANGFIGCHLSRWLVQEGYEVHKAVRQASAMQDHVFQVGDINGQTDWSQALDGVDVVVHAAARVHVLYETVTDPISEFRHANVDATINLAEQAHRMGVKRFVFISTIGVLGNYSRAPFVEGKQPYPSNAYSASKMEAEQQLLRLAKKTGLEVVIIRPPLVYGPGVKANFYRLMQAIDHSKPMPFGAVCNARDFISVANICSLITTCLTHPAAANEIFLAADGEPVSTPALIRKLAAAMGRKAKLIPIPVWVLSAGAFLLRKERFYHSICSSLRIDTSKARTLLGWQPPQSLDDGLRQTVEWYVGQSRVQ